VVKEAREPMVDIFNEEKEILLIAELPGMSESAIQTELKGDILTLKAEENNRKYYKEALLPSLVKPETLRKSFKNGILEIRFEKK
jgi:HSP20 family protein